MILDNLKESGQNIRKLYQRKLPSNPNKDYYYIIRETFPAESVLIEYGFLDSTKDDRKQIKNDWQKWGESVVKAIAEYKGYNYIKPGENTVNDAYIVQRGDSLWSIAKRFNVSVSEIKNTNNLTTNLITIGQKLIIPGFAPSNQTNITYIVQKGDSLWSIANINNTTIDELVNLNDLVSNTIYVGQELKIPNSGTSGVVKPDINSTYIVEKGDTLYSIALKYNTNPIDIINLNNLKSDILTIGQVLIIPKDIDSTGEEIDTPNIYMVKKGDSLWSISNMFKVPLQDLKLINNLSSDLLSVGQTLIIP